MIHPELASLALVENLLHNPGAADLLHADTAEIGLYDVVLRNPQYAGKRLRAVRLPASVLIAAIHRDGQKLIPHGDTVLESGDVLTVVGPRAEQEEVRGQLG